MRQCVTLWDSWSGQCNSLLTHKPGWSTNGLLLIVYQWLVDDLLIMGEYDIHESLDYLGAWRRLHLSTWIEGAEECVCGWERGVGDYEFENPGSLMGCCFVKRPLLCHFFSCLVNRANIVKTCLWGSLIQRKSKPDIIIPWNITIVGNVHQHILWILLWILGEFMVVVIIIIITFIGTHTQMTNTSYSNKCNEPPVLHVLIYCSLQLVSESSYTVFSTKSGYRWLSLWIRYCLCAYFLTL